MPLPLFRCLCAAQLPLISLYRVPLFAAASVTLLLYRCLYATGSVALPL